MVNADASLAGSAWSCQDGACDTHVRDGNLTRPVDDASGADQTTTYGDDASNRLTSVTTPDGTVVAFTYDADGNRNSKAVTSGGTTTVNDLYQLGHLAEQTDGTGTMLARFSYDNQGVPTSVRVGSDPVNSPVYYYVYNGHGDVVALTDASGTSVATYGYDAWGLVQMDTEHFANGWHNPYLYDGHDGARYDVETGLYWLSVRAYDPTLGRFLSHDPLGRAPLFFADQPYAYAGNNPLLNVDPSGQRMATSDDAGVRVERADDVRASRHYAQHHARVYSARPSRACQAAHAHPTCSQIDRAKGDARSAAVEFLGWALGIGGLGWFGSISYGKSVAVWIKNLLIKLGRWLLSKMELALTGAAAKAFLSSAWLTFALANVIVAMLFFWQSTRGDDYWMNASQVPNVLGFIRVGFITAGLVLLLGAVVSSIASPEIAWMWWGAVAGLAAAYWEIAPRALDDLHHEQRDLGDAYTN